MNEQYVDVVERISIKNFEKTNLTEKIKKYIFRSPLPT